MSDDDSAVSGPVSTLSGHVTRVDNGTRCDEHPDREAVRRVQGETDSFGAEYYNMCQECLDEYRKELRAGGICDWCKKEADRLVKHRDIEEGMYGRVYDVCRACIEAERKYWAESEY